MSLYKIQMRLRVTGKIEKWSGKMRLPIPNFINPIPYDKLNTSRDKTIANSKRCNARSCKTKKMTMSTENINFSSHYSQQSSRMNNYKNSPLHKTSTMQFDKTGQCINKTIPASIDHGPTYANKSYASGSTTYTHPQSPTCARAPLTPPSARGRRSRARPQSIDVTRQDPLARRSCAVPSPIRRSCTVPPPITRGYEAGLKPLLAGLLLYTLFAVGYNGE